MVKKIIILNEKKSSSHIAPSKLTARDRRRLKRWDKALQYALENGTDVGFSPMADAQGLHHNQNPMNKVDKATAIPFPKDCNPELTAPHEDVMYRVVNHASQRDPRKKW